MIDSQGYVGYYIDHEEVGHCPPGETGPAGGCSSLAENAPRPCHLKYKM